MNRLEELLVILSEECAEVSQAASKCIRFGMSAYNPLLNKKITNRESLEQELGDMMAMIKLIIMEDRQINEENMMIYAEAKLVKVEKFMRNGAVPAQPISKPHRRGAPRKKTR